MKTRASPPKWLRCEAGHEVATYVVHNDAIKGMHRLDVAVRTLWNRSSYNEVRSLIRKHRPDVCHFQNTFPLMSPSTYYAAAPRACRSCSICGTTDLSAPARFSSATARSAKTASTRRFRCQALSTGATGTASPAPPPSPPCSRFTGALRTWNRLINVYVALTEFAKRKFVQAGFDPGRIQVKPNFVTPDPGVGVGDGNYAVFLGRLSNEKGITTLIRRVGAGGLWAPVAAEVDRERTHRSRSQVSGCPGLRD